MSSSDHTPESFKVNTIYKFFPEMMFREGDPDYSLGPFSVRGDFRIKREERDIPNQRFLVIKPEKGCSLPTYDEYTVEYPEKLIAGGFITFQRKRSALRIKVELPPKKEGVVRFVSLKLRNWNMPFNDYVLYEQQVEGTWIPIEVDGQELHP